MKQFNKTILAVALMAAAGSASAAITANNTSADQAFLVAYDSAFVNTDSTLGRTYNRNLGVTFAQLVAAGSNMSLLNTDLTADANWTAFNTGMTGSTKWAVVDGNLADHSAFVTGNITPTANIDPTNLIFDAAATKINQHAGEVNLGLTGVSSLIKQSPDNFTGQADHPGVLPLSTVWTGVNTAGYSASTAFGTGNLANFYKGSYQIDFVTDYSGFGLDPAGTMITTQADITRVGQLQLNAVGLTAVPLPAAVWLFGAGLMGMLRLNRRKAA